MQQELKNMVFQTVEGQVSLKEFEGWLYNQEDLANRMSEDLILELFTFNYNKKEAKYEFRTFLKYFDKDEFLLWKIKGNLQDLVDGDEDSERIVSDFYWLGDELPFLKNLGYYTYEFEDAEYYGGRKSLVENLKKDAAILLQEILEEENKNIEFRISGFKQIPRLQFSAQVANADNKKEWWQFWK